MPPGASSNSSLPPSATRTRVWLTCAPGELADIESLHIAAYIEALQAAMSKPTVKQHLAAIGMLFDWLVTGHVVMVNQGRLSIRFAQQASLRIWKLGGTHLKMRKRWRQSATTASTFVSFHPACRAATPNTRYTEDRAIFNSFAMAAGPFPASRRAFTLVTSMLRFRPL